MISPTGLTLLELRAAFPTLFYQQSWYVGEQFMRLYPRAGPPVIPNVGRRGEVPTFDEARLLPRAVDLAYAYVTYPEAECWRWYWWTADTDAKSQRVYFGGVCKENGYRAELHRHLHVTSQWVVAA